MATYKVLAKVRKLDMKDTRKTVQFYEEYTIMSDSPENAMESIIVQRKVSRENIVSITEEKFY